MRGLMNEKNAEGKTPLHLWHNSPLSKGVNYFPPPETMFTLMKATFVRLRGRNRSFRVSIRPLGSLEVKEDIDSSESKGMEKISESKKNEEISKIKKTMESHTIVATIIATVTFAAGFTLPGGYIQNEGNNQGKAVLSLPPNGTKGNDRDMAIAMRNYFSLFVVADTLAMLFSLGAIFNYFLAALPFVEKKVLQELLVYGCVFTTVAMVAMGLAFIAGLQTVLQDSSLLDNNANFNMLLLSLLCLFLPGSRIIGNSRDFVRKKFVSLSLVKRMSRNG